MTKTIRQRILGILSRQQAKGQKPVINKSIAKKSFKDYIIWDTDVHNSIMREARYMAQDGLLKRTLPGNYTVTKKGQKSL